MRFGHRFESRYYQRSTLSEDLIVAWELDETSGTRYPYYGGTEFNLTDVNTVGTADAPPGIGGLCATFDGSTEYLYCADPFSPPTALSLFVWIYPLSVTGADMIVTQDRQGTSIDRGFGLYLSNGVVSSFFSADGSGFTGSSVAGAISANAWTLAGFNWNGSSVTTYKNTTAGTPAAFTGPIWNSAEPLRIGCNSVSGTPSNLYHGRASQMLIWRRVITLAEITYLHNSGNGRPLSDWL